MSKKQYTLGPSPELLKISEDVKYATISINDTEEKYLIIGFRVECNSIFCDVKKIGSCDEELSEIDTYNSIKVPHLTLVPFLDSLFKDIVQFDNTQIVNILNNFIFESRG